MTLRTRLDKLQRLVQERTRVFVLSFFEIDAETGERRLKQLTWAGTFEELVQASMQP